MGEALAMIALYAVMSFCIMSVASFVLHYFVALNARPGPRAAWTVGLAYAAVAAVWIFGGPEGQPIEGLLAALPVAALLFWWWRRDFRRAWFEEEEGLPEGAERANDNWAIGLLGVLGLLAAAAFKVAFMRGAF